ncbi:MAG: hypothetical protein ACKO72_02360 [Actinomycetes bacterium]
MLIAVGLVVVGVLGVVVFAAVVARRGAANAPVRDAYPVPRQLDRADFPRPEAPWLVALFTSASCDACSSMSAKVAPLASDEVAVCEFEFPEAKWAHDRYEISGVPMLLVADHVGVVRRAFVGPQSATDVWAAVAGARDPQAGIEPGLGALP